MVAQSSQNQPKNQEPWRDKSGKALDCQDKLELLEQRLAEVRTMAGETLADGLLLGVEEAQLRQALRETTDRLPNPFASTAPTPAPKPEPAPDQKLESQE